jgi:glycosyltransferase involved in cell wall biosynthesis
MPDFAELTPTAQLVPPGDPVALAARTAELLADPARATTLGEAGKLDVLRRFPPGRLAEALAAVYHEVASGGK